MNKLKNIIVGWWYWFQSSPRIKAKAAERMNICRACPHKKGAFCGLCGCVLRAKTSSPEETCPELRWGKMKLTEEKTAARGKLITPVAETPIPTDDNAGKTYLEQAADKAMERGETSIRSTPNSEETTEYLLQKGFTITQIRDKQKAGCRPGCFDNYDIISW